MMQRRMVPRTKSQMAKNTRSLFGMSNRLPRKSKSLSASSMPSEFNIFGCDALVSTNYILENIEQVKKTADINAVEFEDLIDREEEGDVFQAVESLFSHDKERTWLSVKFTDNVDYSQVASYQRYQAKRKNLWNTIQAPFVEQEIRVRFNVKIEFPVNQDTESSVLRWLADLSKDESQEFILERITFTGAVGRCCRIPSMIARALREACLRAKQNSSLQESVVLNLFYRVELNADTAKGDKPAMICISKLQVALAEEMGLALSKAESNTSVESLDSTKASTDSDSSSSSQASPTRQRDMRRLRSKSCTEGPDLQKMRDVRRLRSKSFTEGPVVRDGSSNPTYRSLVGGSVHGSGNRREQLRRSSSVRQVSSRRGVSRSSSRRSSRSNKEVPDYDWSSSAFTALPSDLDRRSEGVTHAA